MKGLHKAPHPPPPKKKNLATPLHTKTVGRVTMTT